MKSSTRYTPWLLFGLVSCIVFSLEAIAGSGQEGGSGVGNGGGAWTCRDKTPAHALIWIELVDLNEAKREFKLKIDRESKNTQEEWLTAIDEKLQGSGPEFLGTYRAQLAEVRARFSIPDDSVFNPTRDIYDRTKPDPNTCVGGTISDEPEQLANFTTQGHLIVNKPLWDSPKLQEIDRAALLVHEAIYRMFRIAAGDTDSARTREIVGYLFSDLPIERYRALLTLPRKPLNSEPGPIEKLVPDLGTYEATDKTIAQIEVTYYDEAKRILFLTERDHDEGDREISSSTFNCLPIEKELHCQMTGTSSFFKKVRGMDKHRIKITDPRSFVWLNMKASGVERATRYYH